jgi:ElaA protein
MTIPMAWHWQHFSDLTRDELHQILVVRQAVFVVEQSCPYADADGLDPHAWHLSGRDRDGRMAAYARVLPPGTKHTDPVIGRLLTAAALRGCGLGRRLRDRAVRCCRQMWPNLDIRISAQHHLEPFYGEAGFLATGSPYDEDGIPHIEMVLSSNRGKTIW